MSRKCSASPKHRNSTKNRKLMTLTSISDKRNMDAPGKPASGKTEDESVKNYAAAGPTRNLCFVQLDGKRMFLNYAYLIAGEFAPEDNIIMLTYTTHIVTLNGRNLESLYESLMSQLPKQIACIDKRYLPTRNETESTVLNIQIEEVEK